MYSQNFFFQSDTIGIIKVGFEKTIDLTGKYFKAPISWYKIDSGTATIRIEKIDDNNAQIVFEANFNSTAINVNDHNFAYGPYSNYFQYFGDRGAKLNFQRYYAKSVPISICNVKDISVTADKAQLDSNNSSLNINISVSDSSETWTTTIIGPNYNKTYTGTGNRIINFPEGVSYSSLDSGEYQVKAFFNSEPESFSTLTISNIADSYADASTDTQYRPFGTKATYGSFTVKASNDTCSK
ncbi:MAG: hypothetical protein U0457_19225 [Candidatus Sericytochromatia bacterium]